MPENQGEKNKRFKEIRLALGLSQVAMAKKLGMQQPNLSAIENGRAGSDILNNISFKLQGILNVNPVWFETGEGQMFLKNEARSVGEIQQPNETGDMPFIDMGHGQYTMFVPLVGENAYGSFPGGYKDPEYIDKLDKIAITVSRQHQGNYIAFEVLGDSMEDYSSRDAAKKSIPDGSVVVCREVQRHLWKYKLHSHKWDSFIFVHRDEGIACKTIVKHDVANGTVVLGSYNQDKDRHPDFTWHLDDVQAIYNVVRLIDER